jgi:hypothetical protein
MLLGDIGGTCSTAQWRLLPDLSPDGLMEFLDRGRFHPVLEGQYWDPRGDVESCIALA